MSRFTVDLKLEVVATDESEAWDVVEKVFLAATIDGVEEIYAIPESMETEE